MAKDDYKDLLNQLCEEVNKEFDEKDKSQEPIEKSENPEQFEAAAALDAVEIVDKIKTLDKTPAKQRKEKLYEEIHRFHRQRVKKSAEVDNEFDSFADHEILEFLLFFAIPRIDTNPVAHDLMNRFYSLHAVINSSKEELMKVPHVTENVVSLLHSIIPIARRIEQSRTKETHYVTTTASAVEVLKPLFFNRNREFLYLICIDQNDRITGIEKIAEGDVNFTAFDIKKFTLAISKYGASKVIMSHNHPAGSVMPSESDIEATRRVQIALSAMSVLLVDHIIIAGDNYYSFYQDNMMNKLYDISDKLFSMSICEELRQRKLRKTYKPSDYVLEKDTFMFMGVNKNINTDEY